MSKIKVGELDLLPIPKWEAYPTYYIGAGGLGYLIISWLMHYFNQYLPENMSVQDFDGARFFSLDTAAPDSYDLPPQDFVGDRLFKIGGDLNQIIDSVKKGFFPGIGDFYHPSEETEMAIKARKKVGHLKDGAGTTRPFGRIGYFYKYNECYQKLKEMVGREVRPQEMRFGGNLEILFAKQNEIQRRCFYIVSSLAGGTGSSCFLDIAATLRTLRKENFAHEKWAIVGVFTLAEVLATDQKVDQEEKRAKMRANTYAALKELNYFLGGNSFKARYGEKGEVNVEISNRVESDSLFDLVYLVDTPNQDNSPLSGREEVAKFLAQSLLLMGASSISHQFLNRLIDTTATLRFDAPYPVASSDTRQTIEQQRYSFSTIGLCQLVIPVEKYLEYGCYRVALELLDNLQDGKSFDVPNETRHIIDRCRLNDNQFDLSFDCCSQLLFSVSPDLIGDLLAAANPMDALREQISSMFFDNVAVRQRAEQVCQEQLQGLFPNAGKGRLAEELDRLVNQGQGNYCINILNLIEQHLTAYRTRLERELEESHIEVGHAQNGTTDTNVFQQNIFEDRNVNQTLDDMEQTWRGWSARLIPGYRRRFISRYEGEIYQISDLMMRSRRVAFILSVWPAKINLIEAIIGNVKELQATYGLDQWQGIRQWFLDRATAVERSRLLMSRFIQVAIEPRNYYDTIFPQFLGNKTAFVQKLVLLVRKGITVGGVGDVELSDWEKYDVFNLAEAILNVVKSEVVADYPVDVDLPLEDAPRYYRLGLDHSLFLPARDVTSFYKEILGKWKRNAQMSLLFDGQAPDAQRYIVSGCREPGSENPWSTAINLSGLSLLEGGTPNKAVLLTLALGFPITRLSKVKDWFKLYTSMTRIGWPLHLFRKDLVELMTEPHLDWIKLPDMNDAKDLYNEAKDLGILAEHTVDEETVTYWDSSLLLKLPDAIKMFFYDFHPVSKAYHQADLEKALRDNPELISPLKYSLMLFSPSESDANQWDQRKTIIDGGEGISLDALIPWLLEARLLSENDLGQLEFDTNLYVDYSANQRAFCYTFFDLIPEKKRITKNDLITGIAQHQPLSRWITKKVLSTLTSPEKLDATRNRYQDGGFSDYLRSALAEMLP